MCSGMGYTQSFVLQHTNNPLTPTLQTLTIELNCLNTFVKLLRSGVKVKLDDFCKESGWSKADVSRKLGVSRAAVSQWDEVPVKWARVLEGCKGVEPGKPDFVDTAVQMGKAGVKDLVAEGLLEDRKEENVPLPFRVVRRRWKIDGDKVWFLGDLFGHGSEWDFEYSAAKILHIRRLLKHGDVASVASELSGLGGFIDGKWVPAHPAKMVQDVKNNVVCPRIVDEVEGPGHSIAVGVNPWEVE